MRLLVLLLIAVPLYAHNGAVTTAAPVEGIVVDGDLGDWPDELPWHEIAIPSFGLRPYDDADFSGRFRLGYDAQGRSLYVGVEVTDGSRVVDGVGGQLSSDGCEIHLDVPHSTQDVPTVLRHAVWGNRRSILTPSGASQPFGDADVEWRRGDGQHIYEWEIDLSVLGDGDLHNRVIGMNVVVLDVDDDGSTRRVVWGQRYHKAPGNLSPDGLTDLRGDVVLTPEPVNDITVQTVSEIEHEALGRAWFRIESEAWDTPLDVVSDANTGVAHLQLPGGAYRLQSLHPPGSMVSLVVSSDSAYHTDVVVPRPRFEAIHAPPVDSTLGSGLRDGDWVNYGVADGVANVHRLHVGLQGELWITTGRGLLRFDGHMLHSYGHIENELLTGQAIGHDSDGRTWIGGSTGIGYFSNDSLWVCGAECGGPQGVVDSFELDVNGRLWLTVGGIGAMYFEDGYFHELTVAEGLASTEIRSMAGGPDGSIWFATDSGLSRWSDGEFTTYTTRDGLPSTEVYGVNVDSAGIVWIACTPDFAGAEGGLASYDGETFRTLSHDQMPQSVVFYPMIDGGGGFWVGTVDGVYRSDPGSLQFRPAPGVAYPYVFTLAEDAHGTMWAGTNGGLSRYARSRLRNLTTQDGFPPAAGAFEFLEDRNGLLWAPTVGGGIARYDGDRFRVFSVEDGLPAPFVQAAALDSTGQIWVATSAGAARLDGERFHPIPGQPTAFCTNIFVDSDERVWLSTFGDGVWIYDGSTWQNLTTATGLPTNEINQVLEARDGSYWLATEAGLVHLVDDDVEVFDEESGINPYISRVVEDGDGNVWVATQGGVSRYDGSAFHTLTFEDGLPDTHARVIAIAPDGHIWVGTEGNGVARYDGHTIQTLHRDDGLGSNAVNDILFAQDGSVWFLTPNGLTQYHPDDAPPLAIVTDIVTDKRLGRTGDVSLTTSQRLLRVEFSGSSLLTSTDDLVYRYRLVGLTHDWTNTRAPHAEFVDLEAGNYLFELHAVDQDLNYSEVVSVSVRVSVDWLLQAQRGALGLSVLGFVLAGRAALGRRRERDATREQLLAAHEEELDSARQMQMELMPSVSPEIAGLQIAGSCITANHVGGDLYQYLDGPPISFALADVTGHAMEAAIPVVMFSGILDKQMEFPGTLQERFVALNRSLCRSLSDHKFICFTMAEIDGKTLRLASCGNPYPLHFHNGDVTELRVDGYPLGVREDTQYDTIEAELHDGDYLVFYSDGIPETINPSEEMFGYERTIDTVRAGCAEGISAQGLVERLMREARGFAGVEPQADDMTCMVVRVEA